MTDLKAGLEALPDDEEFAEYDLWQSDYEGESELCVGKIDARDLTHFKDTLKLVGAYDPNFKLRYPVTMIMRKRKGLFCWGYELSEAVLDRLWEVINGNTDPYQ